MKSIYFLGTILALVLLMNSCKKDDTDLTKPEIGTATVNGEDEDVKVAAGSTMHLDVVFTDNEELGQFKVDIHNNFDGHSHERISATPWSYQMTYALTGKQATEHKDIDVPSDAAAGFYHLILRVLDAEGNEGDFKEVDLLVTNSDQAVIDLTSTTPAMDQMGMVTLDAGDTLWVAGMVSDTGGGIDEIVVVMEEHGGHDHERISEEPLFEADFDLGGSVTTWDLSNIGPVATPSDAEHGDYEFVITVKDTDGNYTVEEFEVHVHQD